VRMAFIAQKNKPLALRCSSEGDVSSSLDDPLGSVKKVKCLLVELDSLTRFSSCIFFHQTSTPRTLIRSKNIFINDSICLDFCHFIIL
jgi:hypothetical protein